MELIRCSNCRCLISNEDSLCPYCNSIVTIPSETIKEQRIFKTQKFNLIIGILTLSIAVLGATFSYFSATINASIQTGSTPLQLKYIGYDENDVTVKSYYISIQYDGGTEIKASNLIPTTKEAALTDYKKADRKCINENNETVCYVYQFSIEADEGITAEFTDILAYITINRNDFTNLSYVLYEVKLKEENGIIVTDKYGFDLVEKYTKVSSFNNIDTKSVNDDSLTNINPVVCLFGYNELQKENYAIDDPKKCITYSVSNNIKHTYQLVIWLEKLETNHNEEELTFEGDVIIEIK